MTDSPWTLKLSNMISAVFSRFSGALRGGSVYTIQRTISLSASTPVFSPCEFQ